MFTPHQALYKARLSGDLHVLITLSCGSKSGSPPLVALRWRPSAPALHRLATSEGGAMLWTCTCGASHGKIQRMKDWWAAGPMTGTGHRIAPILNTQELALLCKALS